MPPLKQRNSFGVLLLELVIAIAILSGVVLALVAVLSPGLRSLAYTKEYNDLQLLLKHKCEKICATGFWLQNVDTQSPVFAGNPSDPAEIWKSELAANGYTRQAKIDVVFLKEVSGQLVDFSTSPFDGNLARDKVRLTLTLYSSTGGAITQQMALFLYPSDEKVYALITFLKNRLKTYAYQNSGNYPASDRLDLLVSTYISEVPNDPHTLERVKVTHKEEMTDWYYNNNTTTRTITLAANSRRSLAISWTY